MSVAAFASGFGGLVYRPVEASAETGDIRGPNFPHIASPMRAAGGASGPLQGIGAAAFEVRHMGFTKDHVISRRDMVIGGAGGAAVVALASLSDTALAQVASLGKFEMVKSDEEWRHELSSEQYAVLRRHATERPWTSPLNKEHRPGTYVCAGCGLSLFSASTKFESGTGWPSFWSPIEGAIATSEDRSFLFLVRTEVHCARCGGHLGHVFNDGPQPTGLRYCMNGVALNFQPENARPAGADANK